MSAQDELKAELSRLVEEAPALINPLQDDSATTHAAFVQKYQDWYTKALKIVAALAPDRLSEFRAYYEHDPKQMVIRQTTFAIQDYVMGRGPHNDHSGRNDWDALEVVHNRVRAQGAILASLSSRIDTVLADVEAALAGEIEDTTLDAARRLVKVNLRAAGVLAGVVLEEHLQRVARDRSVKVKANPTIGDLNDPLKQAGVYSTAEWRRIQYLGDLRNLCAHKKDAEPTKEQVTELIEGANWAVKTIA
jgi:hypothetical protein